MQRIRDSKERIECWVADVFKQGSFLRVPVSKSSRSQYGLGVNVSFLNKTLGLTKMMGQKYRFLTDPVVQEMLAQNIVVDGHPAAANEARRRILFWFSSLSKEQKRNLPTFGNKLKIKSVKNMEASISLKGHYELVRITLDEINSELSDLEVLDDNYKPVKDRNQDKKAKQEESFEKFWDGVEKVKLEKLSDLIKPSNNYPGVQLAHLFAVASGHLSKSAINNYQNAYKWYIKSISDFKEMQLIFLENHVDKFSLSRFKAFLEEELIMKKLSPHHANTMLSAARKAFSYYSELEGVTVTVIDIIGFEVARVTDRYKPYSIDERKSLAHSIEVEISLIKSKLQYRKVGVGENPMDENRRIKKGMCKLENARWLFENALDCKPIGHHQAKKPGSVQKAFFNIINNKEINILDLYEQWNVLYMVDAKILVAPVLRLAQITGMNIDSLLTLELDDFIEEHPATGKPCISYWKERSDGKKEYHLDLFKADLAWLTTSQSKEVKEIFEFVVKLTEHIRPNVKEEYKHRLFIYQSSGVKSYGDIKVLSGEARNSKPLYAALKNFIKKYNLKSDSGNELQLVATRFRPTFVSELLDKNVSVREIQLMLGHKHIETTIGYLDKMDFNIIARKKLTKKLNEIHVSNLIDNSKGAELKGKAEDGSVVFSTPLSSCRNIFDPPDFVKNMPGYKPGLPCSQYNKCLVCENILITVKDLPLLFAMQRDYLIHSERNGIMDTPYGNVVVENLEVLKQILSPSDSGFCQFDLDEAKEMSEYIESVAIFEGVGV